MNIISFQQNNNSKYLKDEASLISFIENFMKNKQIAKIKIIGFTITNFHFFAYLNCTIIYENCFEIDGKPLNRVVEKSVEINVKILDEKVFQYGYYVGSEIQLKYEIEYFLHTNIVKKLIIVDFTITDPDILLFKTTITFVNCIFSDHIKNNLPTEFENGKNPYSYTFYNGDY